MTTPEAIATRIERHLLTKAKHADSEESVYRAIGKPNRDFYWKALRLLAKQNKLKPHGAGVLRLKP